MRQNLNPYNPEQFQKQFESTDICRNVAKDFNVIWWHPPPKTILCQVEQCFVKVDYSFTPRGALITNLNLGFSIIPFYYLLPLLEKTPKTIYDLGCGCNIFQKYIPNIIGIDKSIHKDSNPDIEDQVTPEFIKNHQNCFESVFSINALHFRPISELRLVFEEFISMVEPGGRGFLSVNIKRMLELDFKKFTESGVYHHNSNTLDQYVRTQLDNLPCKYLIFDVNLNILDNWLDGNVRLVFER